MAIASTYLIDDHYVSSEFFEPEADYWDETSSQVVSVNHDFSDAAARLYKRMRRRAKRIASSEGREFVLNLEEDLETLIRGKR